MARASGVSCLSAYCGNADTIHRKRRGRFKTRPHAPAGNASHRTGERFQASGRSVMREPFAEGRARNQRCSIFTFQNEGLDGTQRTIERTADGIVPILNRAGHLARQRRIRDQILERRSERPPHRQTGSAPPTRFEPYRPRRNYAHRPMLDACLDWPVHRSSCPPWESATRPLIPAASPVRTDEFADRIGDYRKSTSRSACSPRSTRRIERRNRGLFRRMFSPRCR